MLLAAATFACGGTTQPTPVTPTYTGSFTAEESLSSGTNGVASCAWRMSYTGTIKMSLDTRQDGTVAGTADVQTTQYAVITQTLVSRLRKSLVLRRSGGYAARHAKETPSQTLVAD